MTNERPAELAPGSVFVWAGVACLGLMWSDKPVWAPGVTQATLVTNQRPVWGRLTNKQAAIWDGQSSTMCGTLYRSSIIIFMMCQNFYNSEKNIVLITRQSEYFIICYLYKSLFHYYATGIRYLHWNICCIITTLVMNHTCNFIPSDEMMKLVTEKWRRGAQLCPFLTRPRSDPCRLKQISKEFLSPRLSCIYYLHHHLTYWHEMTPS